MIPGVKPSTYRTTPNLQLRCGRDNVPDDDELDGRNRRPTIHASAPRRNVPRSHRLNRRSGDGPPHSTPASRVTTHVNLTRPAAGDARARARAGRHFELRTSCLESATTRRPKGPKSDRTNDRQTNERWMGPVHVHRMNALHKQSNGHRCMHNMSV